jgi:hypothetical protein
VVEQLPTVGEIAIVIAGFAGLVVTLRPTDASGTGLNAVRLRLLTVQTVVLMFLSFLPSYLSEISNLTQINTWKWANGAMVVVFVAIIVWRLSEQFSLSQDDNGPMPPALVIAISLFGVQVIFCTVHFFGYIPDAGIVIFLTGVMLNLFTSCVVFILLLFPQSDGST